MTEILKLSPRNGKGKRKCTELERVDGGTSASRGGIGQCSSTKIYHLSGITPKFLRRWTERGATLKAKQ